MLLSKLISRIPLAAVMICAFPILAAEPLIPPETVGMRIVGRMGNYTNNITSGLLLNGHYLYCSLTFGGGLKTLDVSDPTNMTLTSGGEWSDGGGGSGQAYGLAMKGTVLYMANWAPNIGLRVFSIADPARPLLIRTLATTVHAWKLFIKDNLLFISVSNGYDVAGVDIFDISNASNPVFKAFVSSPQRLVGGPAAYGNYMYMISNYWMNVYNISNPASPTFVRQLTFNARTGTGELKIKDGYLYMRVDDDTYPDPDWLEGGLYVFSLTNPSNPQQVEFYPRSESKNMYLQDRYCILPLGGNGVLALDINDPLNISALWQVGMEWPGTGPGGYEECAAGAGDYVFVGNMSGDGCTECGARVYAVHIQTPMAPLIKEVTPDPASVYAGQAYSKQLTLLQGPTAASWTVVQAPPGTQVSSQGLVSGWTPTVAEINPPTTICIRCTNVDGFDDECWQVKVYSIADFDHDDDVDQEDFGAMQLCMAGALDYPAGCGFFDFNQDGHVEEADVTVFIACFGGSNRGPGC